MTTLFRARPTTPATGAMRRRSSQGSSGFIPPTSLNANCSSAYLEKAFPCDDLRDGIDTSLRGALGGRAPSPACACLRQGRSTGGLLLHAARSDPAFCPLAYPHAAGEIGAPIKPPGPRSAEPCARSRGASAVGVGHRREGARDPDDLKPSGHDLAEVGYFRFGRGTEPVGGIGCDKGGGGFPFRARDSA
jgi:hypothetical protein